MSDYISREAMSETPKCPYCGDRMKIRVSLTTPDWGLLSAQYKCMTCESTSPRIEFSGGTSNEKIIERLQAVSSRRAEPKNRALTLEEAQKKCQEDGITWYESLRHESPIVFPAYVTPIDPTDELVNIYTFFASTEETVELYGKEWRCWLRKPAKEEMEGTPWKS